MTKAKLKPKDERINFLIDPATREQLISLAESNNRSLSNYLRVVIKNHLSTQRSKLKKAFNNEKNNHL